MHIIPFILSLYLCTYRFCNWFLLLDVLKRLKVSARIFRARYPQFEVVSLTRAELWRQVNVSQTCISPDELRPIAKEDNEETVELVRCVPELQGLLGSSIQLLQEDDNDDESSEVRGSLCNRQRCPELCEQLYTGICTSLFTGRCTAPKTSTLYVLYPPKMAHQKRMRSSQNTPFSQTTFLYSSRRGLVRLTYLGITHRSREDSSKADKVNFCSQPVGIFHCSVTSLKSFYMYKPISICKYICIY